MILTEALGYQIFLRKTGAVDEGEKRIGLKSVNERNDLMRAIRAKFMIFLTAAHGSGGFCV